MSGLTYKIQLRHDNIINWTTSGSTIVLSKGEIGIVYDTLNQYLIDFKIGNGIDNWDNLPYYLSNYYNKTEILNNSGLTNYYLKSDLYNKTEINNTFNNYYTSIQIDQSFYTKTQIDTNFYTSTQINSIFSGYTNTIDLNNFLSNNYYTQTQINTILGDYATNTYLGYLFNSISGITTLTNYYSKNESNNLFLTKNDKYLITTNIGSDTGSTPYTAIDINKNTVSNGNVKLLSLTSTSDNSPLNSSLYTYSTGDNDIRSIDANVKYTGSNTIVNVNMFSNTVAIYASTSINATSLATYAVSVFGMSSLVQNGSNVGVIGVAEDSTLSNIGVLGSTVSNITTLKQLSGGVNGVGVYAHNPNPSGQALEVDGRIKVNGNQTFNGNIVIGSTTLVVDNGLIVSVL